MDVYLPPLALSVTIYLGTDLFLKRTNSKGSAVFHLQNLLLQSQASDCPLGLECYKDFEEGRRAALAANKPMLLDFTGWACIGIV